MAQDLITTVTTKNDFKQAFNNVHLNASDTVIIHTSLSKFYYVLAGPETVILALKETISKGTIMMPSEVSTNCDPATWEYPPVRSDLMETIRDNMPPYDPITSATEGLGITPEYFRTLPDVVRSNHPYLPIAIWGKNKIQIAKEQPLNLPYGINSPLDYLYKNNGKIVFLGTDYETCTALHYAESTINRPTETWSAATGFDEQGKTTWTDYQNVDLDSYDDFNELGLDFEKQYPECFNQVSLNNSFIKVIEMRPLIDFARDWFKKKDNNI